MFRTASILLTATIFGTLGCSEKPAPDRSEDPGQAPDSGALNDTASSEEDSGQADIRPCSEGQPMLEIGTGEVDFETLSDGDEIQVIHGTQDGHHILGSLRTQNTAEIAVVRFQIIPVSDGVPISDQTYRLQMLPDPAGEPCSWMTVGLYAYLGRIDPGEAPFLDKPVAIQMDLIDENGRTVSQAHEVVPFLPGVEHSTPPTE